MSSNRIWSCADPEVSLELSDEFKTDRVKTFLKNFILTDEDVNTLKILVDEEFEEGLRTYSKYTPANVSQMAMDVTFFTDLFDGTETGDFVVIYLTTRTVILVLATVKPGFPVKAVRKYFTVGEKVRKSPYCLIFEYLCDCLLIFFTENNLLKNPQILGFCTDLPLIRYGINDAIVGFFETSSRRPRNYYDVQKYFKTALVKERYKDIKFTLAVITSINMSVLIYSSYENGPIDIFLNLEKDCEMIYEEEVARVLKWNCPQPTAKHVFIETGLTNMGRSGTLDFIATSSDWAVISQPLSLTRADTDCRLEKLLSEQYIRELIRQILISLHHELLYCRQGDIGQLYNNDSISSSELITFMEVSDVSNQKQHLPGGSTSTSQEDALIAKYVCKLVLIRAALLASICLSRIFLRFQKEDFVIAVECPLLQNHSVYERYIRNFMSVLVPLKKFQIIIVKEDFCMTGGGLATAVGNRLWK